MPKKSETEVNAMYLAKDLIENFLEDDDLAETDKAELTAMAFGAAYGFARADGETHLGALKVAGKVYRLRFERF